MVAISPVTAFDAHTQFEWGFWDGAKAEKDGVILPCENPCCCCNRHFMEGVVQGRQWYKSNSVSPTCTAIDAVWSVYCNAKGL